MKGASRFGNSLSTLLFLLAFDAPAYAQSKTITSEPTAAVVGHAPVITAINITGNGTGPGGTFKVGDVLTVTYTQEDLDGDPPAEAATKATIQWYSDTTAVGTLGSETYTIAATDLGKTISVKLTPHTDSATTDPYSGALSDSSVVSTGEEGGFVTVPDGTRVITLEITGDAEVGETLTAVPSCGASCVNVTYQWQIETSINSGSYADIPGATGLTYKPARTDQKKKIQVIATNP